MDIGLLVTTLYDTGKFLRENRFPRKAMECFEALVANDPSYDNGEYAFRIAQCYLQMGNADTAIEYAQIAIRENPGVSQFQDLAKGLNIT